MPGRMFFLTACKLAEIAAPTVKLWFITSAGANQVNAVPTNAATAIIMIAKKNVPEDARIAASDGEPYWLLSINKPNIAEPPIIKAMIIPTKLAAKLIAPTANRVPNLFWKPANSKPISA